MSALLVAYDIADPRRLNRIAKVMSRYGVRAQKSVFECDLTAARWKEMTGALSKELVAEEDQVRIYAVSRPALAGQTVLGLSNRPLPAVTEFG